MVNSLSKQLTVSYFLEETFRQWDEVLKGVRYPDTEVGLTSKLQYRG